MAKIAFILLCHKDPEAVIKQAQRLTAAGDHIAIHFDARAGDTDYARIRNALSDNANVVFARKRLHCGWGEWSLVQATLHALEAAVEAFPRASHFYMLSGDCMSIKTAEYMHDFLDDHDVDFIESHDFFKSDWIKTGMKEERLTYRHFFNEREHKALFYTSFKVQKALGLSRRIPRDLQIRIGSQWWCLRRETIEKVLGFCRKRRDVLRFFRTTWIPDETFFQTLVHHLVPEQEIESRTLTFLMFTDYGMPVNFYNDHYDMLLNQNYLFARKISPEAHVLKERLGKLYAARGVEFKISDEGPGLYKFVTGRGRVGRRFANRFWESEATLGRNRELMIIVCKKWQVARRILATIRQETNIPVLEFIFNEEEAELPDLGGIQATLHKRTRHRRALMRMLFDYFQTNRMVICLDPDAVELIEDFYGDRSITRMLEIQCNFTEEYLKGHALRIGLVGETTPEEALERILPTLRRSIEDESDRLRDAHFDNHEKLNEMDQMGDLIRPLMNFLSVPEEKARRIAMTPQLFAD